MLQTMRKRKRGDLWKVLFYLSNIADFNCLGLHLGCQKEKYNRVGRRAGCKVGFVFISGLLVESFWELKSSKERRRWTAGFSCVLGSGSKAFTKSRASLAPRLGTVF